MGQGKKTAILVGVVIVAFCAAIPFFRGESPREMESAQSAVETEEFDVPLHVMSKEGKSPALGLYDTEASRADLPPVTAKLPVVRREREELSRPPELSTNYRPPFNLAMLDKQAISSERNLPSPTVTSTADDTQPTERTAAPRYHKIVDGDTLSALAEKYLGSSDRSMEIFQANRDQLSRPNVLPLGVELLIPPRA